MGISRDTAEKEAPVRQLEARDLGCLRGGWPIFAGVNFALSAGQALILIGANGSGKTYQVGFPMLDAVAAADWDAKTAAERLGISASQLIKFVKDHRPAFEMWNREREKRGEHSLK